MMTKRALSITIIAVLTFFGVSAVPAYEMRIEEVINSPTVTCKNDFGVDVPLETWNRILDNPFLMGSLWELYKFQPAYKVTKIDDGHHVVDPTGIIGDIWQVGQSEHSRTYYGKGEFSHWAVPSFFTANGVVIFEYKMDKNKLLGEVKIFMRGENRISRFAMIIISDILISYISNRFKNNLEDVKRLIHDIVNERDKVKKALSSPLLDDFIRCFQP